MAPKTPKPGEAGAPLMGYAEVERLNAAPEPERKEFDSVDEVTAELERITGKPISDITEDEFRRLPVKLKARNLEGMAELDVKFKEPHMTGYWFNWKHKSGQRVSDAYRQGFTACTKDDVIDFHVRTTDENGSIVMGDLVLLKIPKIILWSRRIEAENKAKIRVNRAMTDPRSARLPGESAPVGDYFIADATQSQRFTDAASAARSVYEITQTA